MNMATSNMLKNLRKSRKLTQEQLGILSGMTKSQICKMEKGLLGSEDTVSRLLSAMGYSLEYRVIDNYANSSEREVILEILRQFKKSNSAKYGIEMLGLFGSFSRNEQRDDSDVDVLIVLEKPSLFKYSEIASLLESVLKRKVDLVPMKSGASNEFLNEISNDLIYV